MNIDQHTEWLVTIAVRRLMALRDPELDPGIKSIRIQWRTREEGWSFRGGNLGPVFLEIRNDIRQRDHVIRSV